MIRTSKLQGFTDYSELAPLIRYRHQPGNPDIARLMARDRTVTASIDIRLQMRADKALEDRLAKAHKDKGAVVVMDPNSGDVLALVSEPAPAHRRSTPDQLLDRARYGQYPPGSTFKTGDRDGRAAPGSEARRQELQLPAASRWPRGCNHSRLAQTHSRRRGRFGARHADHGTRHHGFVQCLFRAARRVLGGREGAERHCERCWIFRPAAFPICKPPCRLPRTDKVRCW